MVASVLSKDFKVKSSKGTYSVKFGKWNDFLKKNIVKGDVVIVDKKIIKIYPNLKNYLNNNFIIQIDANENSKSYFSVGEIIRKISLSQFDRSHKIIAIGGGITQDIVAFSASIIFRGVNWIFFPTSILSQCDSCIGSKSSINHYQNKNMLGGFHPPQKIFIDKFFLKSHSQKEIKSGLGEILHYLLVYPGTDIRTLKSKILKAHTNFKSLEDLSNLSLKIKKNIIEIDEFDQGPRRIFNYGHTFGHALEAVTNFRIPHGIAVAYGMDIANYISLKIGLLNVKTRNEMNSVLSIIFSNTKLPDFKLNDYVNFLKKDKKNQNGKIYSILTKGIGKMRIYPISPDRRFITYLSEYFKKRIYNKKF